MKTKQVEELILQSLEHEMGGVKIYETAVACAVNSDLKEEWEKYLEQTRTHVSMLEEICRAMKIDPKQETSGRRVVRTVGQGLLQAMELAKSGGDPKAAELVACEAVVLAETKDHLDWELLGKCAQHLTGSQADALKSASDTVEDQEDEHLYHTKGWCRELWLESLGLKAVLPPPEERRNVKTAIGAARAEQAAEKGR
jgi:rubrerythrin